MLKAIFKISYRAIVIVILLSSCKHKKETRELQGRVILSDTKTRVTNKVQFDNDSSEINSTYDSSLLESDFLQFWIADSSEFIIPKARFVFSTKAFKINSNSLLISCATKPDLVGFKYDYHIEGDKYYLTSGRWTDVVKPADTVTKVIREYFPLHINKNKFEIGDTIYAYTIVKTSSSKKGKVPVTEYLKGNLRAIVQPYK